MSRENVAGYRSAVDALNQRDLHGFLALMDDEVHTESRLATIEGGYHGHDGVRRWWRDIFAALPDFTVEVIDVQASEDVTIAETRNRASGADSRAPVIETLWQVARWRDGKVVWWSSYPIRGEALEAVGLRE
jgi:ketosteroid isomerase-like protein